MLKSDDRNPKHIVQISVHFRKGFSKSSSFIKKIADYNLELYNRKKISFKIGEYLCLIDVVSTGNKISKSWVGRHNIKQVLKESVFKSLFLKTIVNDNLQPSQVFVVRLACLDLEWALIIALVPIWSWSV